MFFVESLRAQALIILVCHVVVSAVIFGATLEVARVVKKLAQYSQIEVHAKVIYSHACIVDSNIFGFDVSSNKPVWVLLVWDHSKFECLSITNWRRV